MGAAQPRALRETSKLSSIIRNVVMALAGDLQHDRRRGPDDLTVGFYPGREIRQDDRPRFARQNIQDVEFDRLGQGFQTGEEADDGVPAGAAADPGKNVVVTGDRELHIGAEQGRDSLRSCLAGHEAEKLLREFAIAVLAHGTGSFLGIPPAPMRP